MHESITSNSLIYKPFQRDWHSLNFENSKFLLKGVLKISAANALKKIALQSPKDYILHTRIIKKYPNILTHTKWKQILLSKYKIHSRISIAPPCRLSFVSLKYSGGSTEGKEREREKKKKRQQLNSVTKAGEPNIDWRAVETTGCRGGYWFFIPIQRGLAVTAAVDDAFKVERENRRGRSIRVPIGPTGLANEPLFAYGGYPRLFPRGNTPGATFHRVARGDGGGRERVLKFHGSRGDWELSELDETRRIYHALNTE